VAVLQVNLSRGAIRRIGWALLGCNLVLTAGTTVFMSEWNHLDWHGPAGRWLVTRVLVQFHLATENVVAAWYSSMLLLTVALAAVLAFATEMGTTANIREKWRLSPFSWGWLLVAAAFVALSLDELGSLHERIGMISRGGGARGWVYVLALPILGVAAFMAAFAWVRLRQVPAALGLFAAGIALFLSNPIFEVFEMRLLHAGRGADLIVHNTLLVVEEGIVELGGALCFLLAVLTYIRRTAGEGPHVFEIRASAMPWIAAAGLAMTAAVPAAHWFVAQLPPGDTGIAENWFPATSLYLLALFLVFTRPRRNARAVLTLALSASFGAAIYGYFGWFQRIGYPGEALDAAVTAAAWMAAMSSTTGPPVD
jgi:hypothetical protein